MVNTLYTPTHIEKILDMVLKPYAKLWPLHSFNACNPLVGLENLPFLDALKESHSLFGGGLEDTNTIFKKLYDRGAFTLNDINHVIENSPFFEHKIECLSSHPYKELCRNELIAIIHDGKRSSIGFSEQHVKTLSEAIVSNSQTHELYLEKEKHQWINEEITKYLAAYLDEGQALWAMPDKDNKSLLDCWAQCLPYDTNLSKEARIAIEKWLHEQHSVTDTELLNHTAYLIDTNINLHSLLNEHLRQLPGWVGYLKYSTQEHGQHADLISQYLIIRLLYHWQMGPHTRHFVHTLNNDKTIKRLWVLYETHFRKDCSADTFVDLIQAQPQQWVHYLETITSINHTALLMEALEHSQQKALLYELDHAYQNKTEGAQTKHGRAQAVFCIDVRSEPYRKALELQGNIETYGFAGFFGLPIAKQGFTDYASTALCPILLNPQYIIPESALPISSLNWLGKKQQDFYFWKEQWIYALKKIKRDTFGTFGYVEGLGAIHGITTFLDTFAAGAYSKTLKMLSHRILNKEVIEPKISYVEHEHQPNTQPCTHTSMGIPTKEQVELAANILKLMGIQQPFSEFIVICGHTGQAKNNPYASALDCGACGAHSGGYNARVLCDILNQSDVRKGLSEKGINIPNDTVFIAAEHNTTTNGVRFLNENALEQNQIISFLALKDQFEKATQLAANNQEKKLSQPALLYNQNELQTMAWDWSQTRPEWGLSKNQAFIIGQRNHLKDIDLEGRAFLHSYNWEEDLDDSILTMIMKAPMVVGTWISCQYLFSTLDQKRFGSGPKYIHNVVGLFGTYQGNQSDLQLGLPYESLFENDGTPYHYPQRLLVFIEAPFEKVHNIVQHNEQVQNLVTNQWIKVVIFDPRTNKTAYYDHQLSSVFDMTAA